MRSLPTVVMLLVAASLGAAEAYRWVDKDGVVHYSDRPEPGAERIPLISPPKPGSVPQAAVSSAPRNVDSETRYSACLVTRPAPDQTFGIADTISIAIGTQPPLQPEDRLTVTLNGARIENWPVGGSTHQLTDLPRGAYTVVALITGPAGNAKCTTAPASFTVFQPSLLSPARPPAPR